MLQLLSDNDDLSLWRHLTMQIADFVHLFFFTAAVQGIFLWLVFWRRANPDEGAFRLLSWIFLTFALILLHWVAFWTGIYQTNFRGIGIVANTLDFALAPLIYFFIRNVQTPSFKIMGRQWLHFVPFMIFFPLSIEVSRLVTGASPLLPISQALSSSWYPITYQVVSNAQFVVYGIVLLLYTRSDKRQWVQTICILFITYFAGRLAYSTLVFMSSITPVIDYVLSVIISASIFSVAYLNQLKPIHFRTRRSYEHSSLSKDHEHIISHEIVDHIVRQKRFLDNDYSIDLLSKELSIPRHHISQALNQHLGKSFSTVINELRVEESMQILQDPQRNEQKIMGVALASGFNNKVSFNKYFKQKTGVSPLEFRKRHLQPVEK